MSSHASQTYFVYILKSLKDNRHYIGMTADLDRRLKEHTIGHVTSTRHRRPLKLVLSEEYTDKRQAQAREGFYKSGKGREWLRRNCE